MNQEIKDRTAKRMAAWQKTPEGRISNQRANAKARAKKKGKGVKYNADELTSAISYWVPLVTKRID